MANIKVEIKDGQLVVSLPVNSDPQPSSTGKSLVVASTHGNQVTDVQVNGKNVVVGVNAFIKR